MMKTMLKKSKVLDLMIQIVMYNAPNGKSTDAAIASGSRDKTVSDPMYCSQKLV